MDTSPSSPLTPPPERTSRWPRPFLWIFVLAVVLVVLLAAVGGTVYMVGQVRPTQVAILSQGQLTLPVPLTIVSTAPNVTWATVRSDANTRFTSTRTSGSAAFVFSWSLVNNESLPVDFVTDVPSWQSSNFVSQPGGSFRYLPAGSCTAPCISVSIGIGGTRAGFSATVGAFWKFNDTVRLMSRPQGFGSAQFLEVDLSPVGLEGPGTYNPGELGISPPGPNDLQLVTAFNTQSGPIFTFSTNESAFQGRAFTYSPAAVTVDAGNRGPLSIRLTSSLTWGSLDWEAVSFSGSRGNFTLHEYVDLRFGSINVTLDPWAGT